MYFLVESYWEGGWGLVGVFASRDICENIITNKILVDKDNFYTRNTFKILTEG